MSLILVSPFINTTTGKNMGLTVKRENYNYGYEALSHGPNHPQHF
jgi:hypothetical protein